MKTTVKAGTLFGLAVFSGMLFLVACTTPIRIMPFAGAPAYPPTDPASVMVLNESPLRPHETLGHVILEPYNPLTIGEMEKMLREAAAGMGAHAVVILANMNMVAGADTAQMGGGHVISAVAIRYKD